MNRSHSANKINRIKFHFNQYDYLLFPIFVLTIFVVSGLYTQHIFLRSLLAVLASFPPFICIKQFYHQYLAKNHRLVLGYFLQLLTSEITSGKTMITAYQDSCSNLISIIGKKNLVAQILLQGSIRIQAKVPIAEIFKEISNKLEHQEGKTVFAVLAEQLRIGGDIDSLLRFSHVMIQDINETEKQIEADNNKQTLEAFILAIIPFLMALFLKLTAPSFFNEAQLHLLGKAALILSFIFAIIATSLTFYFASSGFQEVANIKPYQENSLIKLFQNSKLIFPLGQFVMDKIPDSILLRWQNQETQLGMNTDNNQERLNHQLLLFCACIPLLFLFSLPFSLIFYLGGLLPLLLMPLPGILLISIHIGQKRNYAQQCQESLIQSFPIFSGMMLALLKSGFTPYIALSILSQLLANEKTVLGREFFQFNRQALEDNRRLYYLSKIAKTCNIPEIQATLNLIIQYSQNGNPEALTLLKIQTDICWQLARNKLKKAKEASSMRVLLPMMLNLISIIILCAAPIISRFVST